MARDHGPIPMPGEQFGQRATRSSATIFVYDAGGELVAEYDNSPPMEEEHRVSYMTNDHLGSPRIVTDANGAVVSRKDFAAFGDETLTSQRTTALGYNVPEVRQDYTGYLKDAESGLEYAQARYYNPQHGRFTSVDPLPSSATIRDPQSFNRYSYVLNSPYKFADPLGLMGEVCGAENNNCHGDSNTGKSYHEMEAEGAFDQRNQETRDVIHAISTVTSTAFSNVFSSGTTAAERDAITAALKDILANGNAASQAIAAALVNTGIAIGVAAEAVIGASGDTQFNGDALYTNMAIKNGYLPFADAMGKLLIRIGREEFSNSISVIAAIEGNLIHEGSHAIAMASVLHSMAVNSNPSLVLDQSSMNDEYNAKVVATQFAIDRGGDFVKHGKAAGLINASGNMNMDAINAAAGAFRGQTIMGYLKSVGVHKN